MELHLAPMKGYTCWAFRSSIKGATDSYTEYINLHSLLKKNSKVWETIDTYQIKGQQQWLQILTHNVQEIAKFPKILCDFQKSFPDRAYIYGININAGCPDPSVITAGDGAALIKRTHRLKELIKAFIGASNSHPFYISCKLRLGLNNKEMGYRKILDFLEELKSMDDYRIKPTIIHFKHAKQPSEGIPHWEFLQSFLDTNVPFIINGDINIPSDIEKIRTKFSDFSKTQWNNQVKGIMMGRAVLKIPDILINFNENLHLLQDFDWKQIFNENLKIYPPQNRFILNFKRLYPNIIKF